MIAIESNNIKEDYFFLGIPLLVVDVGQTNGESQS